MHARILIVAALISAMAAMIAMWIGHSGDHSLSWKINQISTYAATAPHGRWVTASMLLSCLTLLILGVLAVRFKLLGDSYFTHLVPILVGATTSGLLMLAAYEETARNMSLLKKASFMAIRQQSFHDAGLMIFFYSAILLIITLGILLMFQASQLRERISGIGVSLFGIFTYPLMTTAWPASLGVQGTGPGLQQRASLFCLWVAVVLVLGLFAMRNDRETRNLSKS